MGCQETGGTGDGQAERQQPRPGRLEGPRVRLHTAPRSRWRPPAGSAHRIARRAFNSSPFVHRGIPCDSTDADIGKILRAPSPCRGWARRPESFRLRVRDRNTRTGSCSRYAPFPRLHQNEPASRWSPVVVVMIPIVVVVVVFVSIPRSRRSSKHSVKIGSGTFAPQPRRRRGV